MTAQRRRAPFGAFNLRAQAGAGAGATLAGGLAGMLPGAAPARAQNPAEDSGAGIFSLESLSAADWLQIALAGALLLAVALAFGLLLWWRRRAERRSYDSLLGAMPTPQQVLDGRGRSFYVNEAFEAHFGRNRGSLPELLRELTDEGPDRERLMRLDHGIARGQADSAFLCLNRGLGSGPAPDDILEMPPAPRPSQWVRVATSPLAGRRRRVCWSVEAVPMNELFDGARRDEQRRVEALFAEAPVGFYRLDAAGRFLFVNKILGEWLDMEPVAMIEEGLRLHDLFDAPPRREVLRDLPPGAGPGPRLSASDEPAPGDPAGDPPGDPRDAFWDPFGDRGQTLEGDIRLRRADGDDVALRLVQDVDRDELGRVRGSRGVLRHVGREQAAMDALAQSARRIKGFFQESPIGIALLDHEGRIIDYNDAMRALAEGRGGLSEEAGEAGATRERGIAEGASLFDLVAESDRVAIELALAAARSAHEVDAIGGEEGGPGGEAAAARRARPAGVRRLGGDPIDVHMAGGGELVCTLYLTPLEPGAGLGPGTIAHFLDTTEQKVLEAQISQSRKMQAVGQLAGGIAHDFNNLLTAMIGFSDLLLLRHRPGDQSFADVMQIKQNANRAANLVRQLLAFSRQQTLRPRILDMTDILVELSHLLRRLIGENIELRMSHGRDLGKVKADQGQLEQVIINLAVNARDAMTEGGQLTIRTGNVEVPREVKQRGEVMPPGRYSCIEVSDTGSGIDPQHMDRIFEPFFSTKEVGAGTGLGLSTVYGIVKQSGGFVFVDSRIGIGTTFSIYLPPHAAVVEEAATDEAVKEPSRDLSGIGTVLLVEDEDGVRSFSARALRNKGYEVLEARSGDAALEVLSEVNKPIDLLITDVVMPKVDGPTLVRQVREQRPDLKVIFISGYTEDSFRERLGIDTGIHFLPKPFSLKQLAGKVKEVMRDSAA